MSRIFTFISGAGFFLTIALGNTPAVKAGNSSCTNATLRGEFGSQISGTFGIGGTSPTGSLAETGIFKFDSQGNMNAVDIGSLNGQIFPSTLLGTYNVKRDCTLTLTFTDAFNNRVNFSGVIVNRGQEIFLIQTDQGTVINGILKKVE
jgi:hypothetical protein